MTENTNNTKILVVPSHRPTCRATNFSRRYVELHVQLYIGSKHGGVSPILLTTAREMSRKQMVSHPSRLKELIRTSASNKRPLGGPGPTQRDPIVNRLGQAGFFFCQQRASIYTKR